MRRAVPESVLSPADEGVHGSHPLQQAVRVAGLQVRAGQIR